MSSEMRELMQSVLDFVNRQPCRCMSIAQLGERDYCDRCQSVKNLRALLARTEAGADGLCAKHGAMWAKGCAACDRDLDQMPGPPDASPVADGAVAWGVEVDGGFDYVSTIMTSVENEAAFYGPEHTIRIIPLYLHPQDASGDAEDAARWRHVRKDGLIWRVNMLALAKDDIDILFGAKADAAVDDAMQAKEAK